MPLHIIPAFPRNIVELHPAAEVMLPRLLPSISRTLQVPGIIMPTVPHIGLIKHVTAKASMALLFKPACPRNIVKQRLASEAMLPRLRSRSTSHTSIFARPRYCLAYKSLTHTLFLSLSLPLSLARAYALPPASGTSNVPVSCSESTRATWPRNKRAHPTQRRRLGQ